MMGHDLKPLTSLRFIAALLVLFDHTPLTRSFAQHHGFGAAGVGFFFVLSGFILTWTYQGVFGGTWTLRDTRMFYVARFARIYPTLVVATVVTIVALWSRIGIAQLGPMLIDELSMAKTWVPVPAVILGANPPSWSIADEAFFYALFPVIASCSLRILHNRTATTTLAVAAVVWIVSTVSLFNVTNWWVMNYFPPVRLIDFTIGVLVAIAVLKGARLPSLSLEAVAILVAAAMLAAIPSIPESVRRALAFIPCSALIIVVFAQQRGPISRVLSTPALIRLGELSYAFYLIHWAVLFNSFRFSEPLTTVVTLFGSLALAWAANVLVERPARTFILSLADRKSRVREVPVPVREQQEARSV